MRIVRIPHLFAGGIMLSYRCSNRCAHSLYRCSPDWPDELHPEITGRTHPVFVTLCREGPRGLCRTAKRYGFSPRSRDYAGKCDFCYDARRALAAAGNVHELHLQHYYRLT